MTITSERNLAGRMQLRGFAPFLDPEWNTWMDPNLVLLSSLAQCSVLSVNVPIPDAMTAVEGSVRIVPSTATNNANEIAIFDGGEYTFVQPWLGLLAYDEDGGRFIFWNGSAWVDLLPSSLGGPPLPNDLNGLSGQRLVVNSDEDAIVAEPVAYDIPLFVGGLLEPNGGIRFLITRDMFIPANFAGSLAMLQTAADAPVDIDVRRNGMSFGTIQFAAGAAGGTFAVSSREDFSAGDLFEIIFPDPQNATASGLSVSIAGTQT